MNRTPILFLNVLVIAACGLVYELLAGTVASYVIGDSVTQFSLIIGLYLSALGVGAWLSRYLEGDLAARFVEIEIGVALTGGLSGLRVRAAVVMVILVIAFVQAKTLTSLAEEELFADEIVYATSSPYQRIVVTRGPSGFHLFLNGNLQFSSADEYRYHEALVHPAMSLAGTPRRVLICGGGDGLALREVLRYPSVQQVTLVDLDPKMTSLSRAFPALADLNRHSFSDPRVRVINKDAMIWLGENAETFDAAIVD